MLSRSRLVGTNRILDKPTQLNPDLHQEFLDYAKRKETISDELEKKEYDEMETICSSLIKCLEKRKSDIGKFLDEDCCIYVNFVLTQFLINAYISRSIANREQCDYDAAKVDLDNANNIFSKNFSEDGLHRLKLKILNAEANLSDSYDVRIRIYSECLAMIQREVRGELTPIFDEYSVADCLPPRPENLLEVYSSCLNEAQLGKQYNVPIQRRVKHDDFNIQVLFRRILILVVISALVFGSFYFLIGEEEY